MRVAVVGGGIGGLSAAWELSSHPGVTVEVLEGSDRLGGNINTIDFVGRRLDLGPDNFLRRIPDAMQLCREIGLDELIAPAHGTARVWLDGRLVPIPGGLVLGAPVRFDELERSDILTAPGLERARAEATLEPVRHEGDRTVGGLIRERYGDEVAERLVAPLLGGIAAGDIDEMSVEACVPQFAAAVRRGPSLTEGLAAALPGSGHPEPVFAAPPEGMFLLIERLAERLAERGVRIRTRVPVTSLDDLDADAVVVATNGPTTARLVERRSPDTAAALRAIPHASVVFVAIAYRRDDIPGDLDASGFLVPRDAGFDVTAASWSSSKWARLAGDPVILRVSLGHVHHPDPIDWSDEEVIAAIRRDLAVLMGLGAEPVDWRIARFRDGFPQYRVGHLQRVDALEAALAADAPNLAICGMPLRGVGIPAVIGGARRAARELLGRISA